MFKHMAAAVASTHTEHHLAAQDLETETAVPVTGEAIAHLMGLPVQKRAFYLFQNLDLSVVEAAVAAVPIVMEMLVLQEPEEDMVEMEVAIPALQPKTMVMRAPTDTVAAVVAVAHICPILALVAVAVSAALPSGCT